VRWCPGTSICRIYLSIPPVPALKSCFLFSTTYLPTLINSIKEAQSLFLIRSNRSTGQPPTLLPSRRATPHTSSYRYFSHDPGQPNPRSLSLRAASGLILRSPPRALSHITRRHGGIIGLSGTAVQRAPQAFAIGHARHGLSLTLPLAHHLVQRYACSSAIPALACPPAAQSISPHPFQCHHLDHQHP